MWADHLQGISNKSDKECGKHILKFIYTIFTLLFLRNSKSLNEIYVPDVIQIGQDVKKGSIYWILSAKYSLH